MAVLIVVLLIAAAIVLEVWGRKKIAEQSQTLSDQGFMLQRGKDFFKQKHVFHTSVDNLSTLARTIDQMVLNQNGIITEPQYEKNQIVFNNKRAGGTFVAAVKAMGYSSEKNEYRYSYQIYQWTEKENNLGIREKDMMDANFLLTVLERAFITMDYNAIVERSYIQVKTNIS